MTLQQLHEELIKLKIPEDWYYMHGLYGQADDNEKLALTIYKDGGGIIYEVYFKEKEGEKNSIKKFKTESEACEYIFKELRNQKLIEVVQNINGISGMTVNERLLETGFLDEFDKAMINNKSRARKFVLILCVDEKSINQILA